LTEIWTFLMKTGHFLLVSCKSFKIVVAQKLVQRFSKSVFQTML
jgi:hypothetical protein